MPRFVIQSSTQFKIPSGTWEKWIKLYQNIDHKNNKTLDEFEETIKNYFLQHPSVASVIHKSVKSFRKKPSNTNHCFTLALQYLAQSFVKNNATKNRKQSLHQIIKQQKFKPLTLVPASQINDIELDQVASPILGIPNDGSLTDEIEPSPFIQPSANDANVCQMFLPILDESQQTQPGSSFDIFDQFETQL